MAPPKIARISHEEDVFAADETKVRTLSRQAISEMLDTAAREEANSSAPPPPESGVRAAEASRPVATKSGMMLQIPAPAPLPSVVWSDDDDDDDGLEPTVLHERASLPRQQLVTQLMNEPPIIICPEPAPEAEAADPIVIEAVRIDVRFEEPEVKRSVDRRALAITIATFLATVVPALVLLHHLLHH